MPDPPDAKKRDDLVSELNLTGLVRQRQRHALTWMADAGVDLHIVQRAAGHSGSGRHSSLPASDVQAMLEAGQRFLPGRP